MIPESGLVTIFAATATRTLILQPWSCIGSRAIAEPKCSKKTTGAQEVRAEAPVSDLIPFPALALSKSIARPNASNAERRA